MNKIFKSGILSLLSCTVLIQSAVVGYSSETAKASNSSDNASVSSYADGDLTDYAVDNFDNDINKDYSKGLEILESAEVSDDYASKNDPLYKKYKSDSPMLYSSKAFGVAEPKTPTALVGLDVIDGIDVSMYQAYSTPIDWNKVKAAGVSYAIIRCGYRGWGNGKIVADSYFKQNIEGALAAGLQVGVYFYTQAITATEARQEADFCINAVKGYNITLPIYIDIEFADADGRLDSKNLSKTSKTNICKAFANRVQNAGYTGGVYANKSWLETEIDGKALGQKYAIWLAHYNNSTTYANEFSMWQYSSKGSVNGIKGSVDINKYYLSKPHTVTGLKANDSTNNDPTEFYLTWSRAAGAYRYQVKTFDDDANAWVSLGTTNSNKMVIKDLGSNKEYQYKVRAYKLIGDKKIYGSYSSVVTYQSPLTKVTGLTQTNAATSSVSLKWNKLATADGYYIKMYNSEDKKWEEVKKISGNENITVKITKLDYATCYKFIVQGYSVEDDGKEVPLINSAALKTVTDPKKASGLKYTKTTASSITLTWNKLDRGSGYQVLYYDKAQKKYVVCKTVSGKSKNKAKVTGLKSGTTYKFIVRGYKTIDGVKWAGTKSSAYSMSTLTAKVSTPKATFKGKKGTLTWKACTGAAGYQVQKLNAKTNKWKTVKTITGKKNNKYKFNLAKKKSAKYRVRAYRVIKGKTRYGAYSARKTVKNK